MLKRRVPPGAETVCLLACDIGWRCNRLVPLVPSPLLPERAVATCDEIQSPNFGRLINEVEIIPEVRDEA